MLQDLESGDGITDIPRLTVELSTDTVPVVARLRGELDVATVGQLEAVLHQLCGDGYRFVMMDLSRLEFFCAAGLGVLVTAAAELEQQGGKLTIANPSRIVRRVLAITKLDRALSVV